MPKIVEKIVFKSNSAVWKSRCFAFSVHYVDGHPGSTALENEKRKKTTMARIKAARKAQKTEKETCHLCNFSRNFSEQRTMILVSMQ